MKEIPLSQGKVALVDDEDYERVNKFQWVDHKSGNTIYVICKWNGTLLSMHRFILGAPPSMQVDHIDHDGLNNQRANIRLCTKTQNMQNMKKTRGTSKYKGASFNKESQKWYASICVDGVRYYLGIFDTEEEAGRAYDAKARKCFEQFACLNFPKE